jgi:thiamine kinase-like enzyme
MADAAGDVPAGPGTAIVEALTGALQAVPDLRGRRLRITTLAGGITNRNFRVDLEAESGVGGAYAVRLGGEDTHLLGISREVEHAATLAAAAVGVAPEVIAWLPADGILVTRFIEGDPVPLERLREPAMLRRLAASLRLVHDGPAIPGLFVPFRTGEAYLALARSRGVPVPEAWPEAHEVARRIEVALLTRPPVLRPCHNDLLNANLIDDGARVRIVDWEYAGMGDAAFDLGNVCANHDLSESEEMVLLGAYAGHVRPEALARLRVMRVMSDFREAMWGVLQGAISGLDVDFAGYAARHFRRLLEAARAPAFRESLAALAAAHDGDP